MPESLGNLTALTELYLGGNRLASVPESLGNLTALTELYLNGNQLASVPESLGNLTALTASGPEREPADRVARPVGGSPGWRP